MVKNKIVCLKERTLLRKNKMHFFDDEAKIDVKWTHVGTTKNTHTKKNKNRINGV